MTPSLRAQLIRVDLGVVECIRKRSFATERAARTAATKPNNWRLRAYRCDHCSKWHLSKKLFFHRAVLVVKDTERIPL